ncbi:MAG: LamG domain-containing protein [Gemmatimonadaceae bacterium]|nr:LamG domain-containing protein [Chitinophagaceae bacterium]
MKTIMQRPMFSILIAGALVAGCTKANLDDDFEKGDAPPISNYINSSEVAPAELVAFFPFDGNVTDSKNAVTGGVLNGNGGFAQGKKGQAYQGGTNAFISYATAGPLANLTSFTVSMWINTQKHDGGAQGVFAVSKADGSFWGNFFMLIEGAGATENNMLVKVHFEKNVTPPVSNIEHWMETTGNKRIGDMYGSWRHIAYTYDETTSVFAMYANGTKIAFTESESKRMANATTPLGALAFKNANRFVIGGFQNQLGAPYNSPETWMLPYTGKLDEFRVYKKALTSQELNALFQLEKQGR